MLEYILAFLDKGATAANFWQIVLYTLAVTHVTIATVTIYLHRHAAHRALELNPLVAHFFRFWTWLTTGIIPRQWVAVHRKHHATCETQDDPHSPVILGIGKVLLQGAELYRISSRHPPTVERYGGNMPDDWIEHNLYAVHSTWGITTMLIINLILFGVAGLAVWAIQMMWIPIWAAGVINGVGHYLGYRNYECPDAAVNIVPWGIFIGGEELHNNHHTYPNSAKLSSKWWEFDVGWFYICILSALRLAKVSSKGPVVNLDKNKTTVDMATAQAAVNDRFQIMSKFSYLVIKPIAAQEYRKSAADSRVILKQAYPLLSRAEFLLRDADRACIQDALGVSDKLEIVYGLQQRLRELWQQHGRSKQELLEAFSDWVDAAERTGIEAVCEFANNLKHYSLPLKRPLDT